MVISDHIAGDTEEGCTGLWPGAIVMEDDHESSACRLFIVASGPDIHAVTGYQVVAKEETGTGRLYTEEGNPATMAKVWSGPFNAVVEDAVPFAQYKSSVGDAQH